MKTLVESITGRSRRISKKEAIKYAEEYVNNLRETEGYTKYARLADAGEALYYLSGCVDAAISAIANKALDSTTVDENERLEERINAIIAISEYSK